MRKLVGAVRIEPRSIIPKPLCFQLLTYTHRKANRGQTEVKDCFGCLKCQCILYVQDHLRLWQPPTSFTSGYPLLGFLQPIGLPFFVKRGCMGVSKCESQRRKWTRLAQTFSGRKLALQKWSMELSVA